MRFRPIVFNPVFGIGLLKWKYIASFFEIIILVSTLIFEYNVPTLSYFCSDHLLYFSAGYLAEQLNLSTRYLSDLLKQLTGITTQQLIQNKIIDLSKDSLTGTTLSVSEISYQLGFEYPQSFSKLFKAKTN